MTNTLSPPDIRLTHRFHAELSAKLWDWLNSPRLPNFDDFGARTREEFGRDLGHRISRERTWGIDVAGTVLGYVGFAPSSPMAGQFHGMVIAPPYRHLGIGTAAMFLAVEKLRAEGFTKLMAIVHADNIPICKMFHRVGFAQEGYLTAATQRDGKPLDLRMLSLPGRPEGGDPKCLSGDYC